MRQRERTGAAAALKMSPPCPRFYEGSAAAGKAVLRWAPACMRPPGEPCTVCTNIGMRCAVRLLRRWGAHLHVQHAFRPSTIAASSTCVQFGMTTSAGVSSVNSCQASGDSFRRLDTQSASWFCSRQAAVDDGP